MERHPDAEADPRRPHLGEQRTLAVKRAATASDYAVRRRRPHCHLRPAPLGERHRARRWRRPAVRSGGRLPPASRPRVVATPGLTRRRLSRGTSPCPDGSARDPADNFANPSSSIMTDRQKRGRFFQTHSVSMRTSGGNNIVRRVDQPGPKGGDQRGRGTPTSRRDARPSRLSPPNGGHPVYDVPALWTTRVGGCSRQREGACSRGGVDRTTREEGRDEHSGDDAVDHSRLADRDAASDWASRNGGRCGDCRPRADRRSGPLERGRPTSPDVFAASAGPATLIAKSAVGAPENRQMAMAVGCYEREVRFYEEIAPRPGVRVPGCLAADLDGETGEFVLLLEDLTDVSAGDQLTGGQPRAGPGGRRSAGVVSRFVVGLARVGAGRAFELGPDARLRRQSRRLPRDPRLLGTVRRPLRRPHRARRCRPGRVGAGAL